MPILSADNLGMSLAPRRRPSGGGGGTPWSIPPIPGFQTAAKHEMQRKFAAVMGVAVVAGRRSVGARGLRGLGVTCPQGLVQTTNGGCLDPSLYQRPGVQIANVNQAKNYAAAPTCNVVDLTTNTCMLDNGSLEACTFIRDCDPLTGASHCQSGNPGTIVAGIPICGAGGPSVPVHFSAPNPTGPSTAFTPTISATAALPVPKVATTVPYSGFSTPAPAAGVAPTIQLQNMSRPGQPFQVGDNWSLTLTGAPNAAVINTAAQNGISIGATPYGQTDGNGKLVLTGTFTPDTVGTWSETWQVGTGSASVSFTVANAPVGAATPPTGSTATGGGGQTATDSTTAAPPDSVALLPSSISSLPWGTIALVAGGGLILWMLFGGKR
jgi:hypothetical protein